MSSAYPALGIQTFDMSGPLNIYEQTRARRVNEGMQERKMGMLEEQHDLNVQKHKQSMALAQARAGQMQQQAKMKNQQAFLDTLYKYTDRADTPAKWRVFVQKLGDIYGQENIKGYEDFSQRPAALKMLKDATAQMKNYNFRESLEPEKQEIFDRISKTDGISIINTGTGSQIVDKQTGAPIREVQKDIVGQKQQESIGKKLGESQFDLPKVVAKSDEMVRVIDDLIKHPGRKTATGFSSVIDPRNYVPGTDAYNFAALHNQIAGQAFLQAFESIKGGGQITEVEGKKATQAITRIKQGLSDAEYVKELNTLRQIVLKGRERAEKMARGKGVETSSQPGQTKSGNDPLGLFD